jgi:hypothetical protein
MRRHFREVQTMQLAPLQDVLPYISSTPIHELAVLTSQASFLRSIILQVFDHHHLAGGEPSIGDGNIGPFTSIPMRTTVFTTDPQSGLHNPTCQLFDSLFPEALCRGQNPISKPRQRPVPFRRNICDQIFGFGAHSKRLKDLVKPSNRIQAAQ